MAVDLIVHTRPWCSYSFRLRRALRRRRVPFREIDIRVDRDAAAAVREHADGNEVVPTVRLGDQWLVNPTVDEVCALPGVAPVPKPFRMSAGRRIGDGLVSLLSRAGIGPMYVLTTRGRRTGQLRTTPIVPVVRDGQRWLVAPYGSVAWVHNARAAGTVTLRRGRDVRTYRVIELSDREAAPILKEYLGFATATRPYFQATAASPVADFEAEAHLHPVFRLTPTG
jgi:deazaflavin-dependent oxidoreductase (nitroreductase family)